MSRSCCGQRSSSAATPPAGVAALPGGATAPPPPAAAPATIRYFYAGGAAAITVWGRVTGRRYHFGAGGATNEVDIRDAPSLRGIPGIEQVGSSQI